jgi:hypothetical protein
LARFGGNAYTAQPGDLPCGKAGFFVFDPIGASIAPERIDLTP